MQAMEIDEIIPSLENVVWAFKNKMRETDMQARLEAMKTLSVVASAYKQEKARLELVPYLSKIASFQENQVQIVLAEQIGQILQCIGGPDYAINLLSILEDFCLEKDNNLTNASVNSIYDIALQLSEHQLKSEIFPLLKRLYKRDSCTASKSSAAKLLSKVCLLLYNIDKETNNELNQMVSVMLKDKDDSPTRAALANNLHPMILQLTKDELLTIGLDWLSIIATDELNDIRLLSVDIFIEMARVITNEEEQLLYLIPILIDLLKDPYLGIRCTLAASFALLSQLVWTDTTKGTLISTFKAYMTDPDTRLVTIKEIPKFTKLLLQKSNENMAIIEEYIIPSYVIILVEETNNDARVYISSELNEMAPYLGKESALRILVQFLKDESPEVNLNAISAFDKFDETIFKDNQELSTCLLSAIFRTSQDKQWRTRLNLINYVPLMIQLLGKSFLNDQLLQLCLDWLCDKVFGIRQAAALNLKNISLLFGATWTKTKVIDQIETLAKNKEAYTHRLSALFALTAVAESLKPEDIKELIVPTIIELASDPVPNIRLNVAKSLESLIYTLKQHYDIITPVLSILVKDSDSDVVFFASRALETTEAVNNWKKPNL